MTRRYGRWGWGKAYFRREYDPVTRRPVGRFFNPYHWQRHHDGTFTKRGKEKPHRSAMHAAYHARKH